MQLEDLKNPNAPWLVFLHGLMGSAANWRRIVPAFDDEYQVLTYDQKEPKSGYSPVDYAEDLFTLLGELKIPKINLVGHSQGGRIAVAFSLAYPHLIEKLVIEDIGPDEGGKRGKALALLLKSIPAPFPSKKEAKEFLLNELGDPKLGNFLYTKIGVLPNGTASWTLDLNAILLTIEEGAKFLTVEKLQQIKCPTLIMRGQNSREWTHSDFSKIINANSLFKGVEIPGAGHWVHFDEPNLFIRAVKTFLEEPKK